MWIAIQRRCDGHNLHDEVAPACHKASPIAKDKRNEHPQLALARTVLDETHRRESPGLSHAAISNVSPRTSHAMQKPCHPEPLPQRGRGLDATSESGDAAMPTRRPSKQIARREAATNTTPGKPPTTSRRSYGPGAAPHARNSRPKPLRRAPGRTRTRLAQAARPHGAAAPPGQSATAPATRADNMPTDNGLHHAHRVWTPARPRGSVTRKSIATGAVPDERDERGREPAPQSKATALPGAQKPPTADPRGERRKGMTATQRTLHTVRVAARPIPHHGEGPDINDA